MQVYVREHASVDRGGSGKEWRGHLFHASVPLPFMLGVTYMHPSPTIKH